MNAQRKQIILKLCRCPMFTLVSNKYIMKLHIHCLGKQYKRKKGIVTSGQSVPHSCSKRVKTVLKSMSTACYLLCFHTAQMIFVFHCRPLVILYTHTKQSTLNRNVADFQRMEIFFFLTEKTISFNKEQGHCLCRHKLIYLGPELGANFQFSIALIIV